MVVNRVSEPEIDDIAANMLDFTNDGRIGPSVGRDLGAGHWSDWRYDMRFDRSYRGGRSGGRPGGVVGRAPEPENGGRLNYLFVFTNGASLPFVFVAGNKNKRQGNSSSNQKCLR